MKDKSSLETLYILAKKLGLYVYHEYNMTLDLFTLKLYGKNVKVIYSVQTDTMENAANNILQNLKKDIDCIIG